MSSRTDIRLAPRERLARGLKYSAVGPVDITRGVVGLSADSVQSTAAELRRRYQAGQWRKELAEAQQTIAQELAAAQEIVAQLPHTLQDTRGPRCHRRPWLLAAIGVLAVAGGAVAFSIVRRSSRPEPSPRPPSVEVEPKP